MIEFRIWIRPTLPEAWHAADGRDEDHVVRGCMNPQQAFKQLLAEGKVKWDMIRDKHIAFVSQSKTGEPRGFDACVKLRGGIGIKEVK
jgi:hypothetical protein